jgi:ABC-type sulfate transport system permease subunit
VGFLRAGTVAVAAASLAALLLPDEASHAAAITMVSALVVVPITRVAWLAVRWLALGDRRFAGEAIGLLAIVACGAALAFAR